MSRAFLRPLPGLLGGAGAASYFLHHWAGSHNEFQTKQFPGNSWAWNWDNRQNSHGKGTRTLIFVRHGQYVHAKTDLGKVLTPLGREQARITGRRLNEIYGSNSIIPGNKIDNIIYSTMTRATETSNIIREELPTGIPADPSESIREGAVYPPVPIHPTWRPSAEEFEEDGERIEGCFKENVHRAGVGEDQNTTTLFVCHGNVIRYFFMRALQLPPSAWLRLSVANGSITTMSINSEGRVNVSDLGNSGHFPPEKVTYN
jgi:serine/threonine-protein phosphatase PGAM5